MIIIRKTRGPANRLPERKIKTICLHELTLQTIKKYADLNLTAYPFTTNNPQLVIDFLNQHLDILSNPYSAAQDKVVQSISVIINHPDSLDYIEANNSLFSKIIENLHQNLNYNLILDCTVFKTPNNFLYPNSRTLTTYFLIIQTKSITSDVSLIKNFSDIKRKIQNGEFFMDLSFINLFWNAHGNDRAMLRL